MKDYLKTNKTEYSENTPIHIRIQKARETGVANDDLISDYLPFIKSEASKIIKRVVTEQDDEFSVALIGFNDAVNTYSETKGAFLKYASTIIHHRLIDYYRKEKRHLNHISIDETISGDSEAVYRDTIQDDSDEYLDRDTGEATKHEILELIQQLREFGLSLSDISDNCPKQKRTLESCKRALAYAKANHKIIQEMKRTKKLPLAMLVEGSGVERKTLERHRKYMIALMLIYSNGYDIIRGHIKQVLNIRKGEER